MSASAYRRRVYRKRRSPSLGGYAPPVAFAGAKDADGESQAHSLTPNPNSGKRHASRAGISASDPLGAQRGRVSRNQGRRKRGEIARQPYLETSWSRIPSLPSALSKRPLKG